MARFAHLTIDFCPVQSEFIWRRVMQKNIKIPFLTLVLMISFASVNAVLFTPALPNIAHDFQISESIAQQMITWFMIGYAIGQLLYGPIANRYGRKPAIYMGISVQIMSNILCIIAGFTHSYLLLVAARFLMALGSGVGLKMTFTLLSESYEPKMVSHKLSCLMLAFAITPGLAVALGGILNTHFGWMSCFYAGAIYGLCLLLLTRKLPETLVAKDIHAFELKHLAEGYMAQFKNIQLMAGGLLMGGATAFVYVFAAVAPFLAISILHMSGTAYGLANLLPPIGLMLGSLASVQFLKRKGLVFSIRLGIAVSAISILIMIVAVWMKASALMTLFLPMILIYFGLALIFANASTAAMDKVMDKAHGSAAMNFMNVGFATLIVLMVGLFQIKLMLLPIIFLFLVVVMIMAFNGLKYQNA
jgi:predicted MFS family arabinose efflux permease